MQLPLDFKIMKLELTKLIIDRNTWLRGESDSYLLRVRDQKLCCLGFYGNQCLNIPFSAMAGVTEPTEYNKGVEEREKWHDFINSREIMEELIEINDDRHIKDDEREAQLTELFLMVNIEVTFIN